MNNLLLAFAFLALPLAGAATMTTQPALAASATTELGDLSSLRVIVADTLAIANSGDLAAAQRRLTDFETAWDADASRLRALSTEKWGNVDDASDAALAAVRTTPPSAEAVATTLTSLIAVLDDPTQPVGAVPTPSVANPGVAIATTDANGRPVPCEEMLKQVRASTPSATLGDAGKATVDALQNKGIERCNADDDKRADEFFAQALTLIGN